MKSTHSNPNGACVEVERDPLGDVIVWDDKMAPDGEEQIYSQEEWEAFIKGVKAGEFDYDKLPVREKV